MIGKELKMQQDMTNIAYTKEYKNHIEYFQNRLFNPEHYQDEETKKIDNEINVLIKDYILTGLTLYIHLIHLIKKIEMLRID